MRWALLVLLVGRGLLHLLGFAKAFGLAELSQLTQPIPPALGVVWLVAAAAVLGAGVSLTVAPRWFWMIALGAAVVSQLVIVSAWQDAKWGTVANVLLLVAAAISFFTNGPTSLRSEYERRAAVVLAAARAPLRPDTSGLPAPLVRYLETTGALRGPMPRAYRVRWRGRIRGGPSSGWMSLDAEQINTLEPMARLFYMDCAMAGVAIPGLHAYVGDSATMDVRVLGMLQVADVRGPEMTKAETVTLFNDLTLLCPAGLTLPCFRWEAVAEDRVRGHFENAGHRVSAELVFNADGTLKDFVSEDRTRSVDGKAFERVRWSTPMTTPRAYGPLRLMSKGEGRWHPASGEFTYVELELLEVELDPTPVAPRAAPAQVLA